MMDLLIRFLRMLKKNYLKLVVLLAATLGFFFILFPLDDLSELVSSQVSKATQNNVYLQFDTMNLSIIPQPGISVSPVYIETLKTPALTAQELIITPSIGALIGNNPRPYGHVAAKGIFAGDIDLWLNSGSKSENGNERHKIEIRAKEVSLQSLRDLGDLPVLLRGKLNLEGTALADLTFTDQPEMDLNMSIEKFEMPSTTLNLPDGSPMALPGLKLTTFNIKGRLNNSKFIIEEGRIGKEGDDIFGSIKGDLSISINNREGNHYPELKGYDLQVKFKVSKDFQSRAKDLLKILDRENTTSDYNVKISAQGVGMPPSISPLPLKQ